LGWTAAHYATATGSLPVLRLLAARCGPAALRAVDREGRTPFHYAAGGPARTLAFCAAAAEQAAAEADATGAARSDDGNDREEEAEVGGAALAVSPARRRRGRRRRGTTRMSALFQRRRLEVLVAVRRKHPEMPPLNDSDEEVDDTSYAPAARMPESPITPEPAAGSGSLSNACSPAATPPSAATVPPVTPTTQPPKVGILRRLTLAARLVLFFLRHAGDLEDAHIKQSHDGDGTAYSNSDNEGAFADTGGDVESDEVERCLQWLREHPGAAAAAAALADMPDADGHGALHLAALRGATALAELLLDAGASIDGDGAHTPGARVRAPSPLCCAVAGGHRAVATLLIARGASVLVPLRLLERTPGGEVVHPPPPPPPETSPSCNRARHLAQSQDGEVVAAPTGGEAGKARRQSASTVLAVAAAKAVMPLGGGSLAAALSSPKDARLVVVADKAVGPLVTPALQARPTPTVLAPSPLARPPRRARSDSSGSSDDSRSGSSEGASRSGCTSDSDSLYGLSASAWSEEIATSDDSDDKSIASARGAQSDDERRESTSRSVKPSPPPPPPRGDVSVPGAGPPPRRRHHQCLHQDGSGNGGGGAAGTPGDPRSEDPERVRAAWFVCDPVTQARLEARARRVELVRTRDGTRGAACGMVSAHGW